MSPARQRCALASSWEGGMGTTPCSHTSATTDLQCPLCPRSPLPRWLLKGNGCTVTAWGPTWACTPGCTPAPQPRPTSAAPSVAAEPSVCPGLSLVLGTGWVQQGSRACMGTGPAAPLCCVPTHQHRQPRVPRAPHGAGLASATGTTELGAHLSCLDSLVPHQ